MPKKYTVQFVKSAEPITDPVTKFGGQLVWLNEPEWPLSNYSKQPMTFVGQIALSADLFPNSKAEMAYLFVTGDGGESFEYDGRENAVVLQSATEKLPMSRIPWPPLEKLSEATGPTVSAIDSDESEEFAVKLTPGTDPEYVEQEERWEMNEDELAKVTGDPEEVKIGGTPYFIQDDHFVLDQLVLQINKYSVPFKLNIGCGYLMIARNGTTGAFLWQAG